ncbi:MAG TPA: flagellar hook-basal body complex protein FliE [Bryobacteraceae bacterium]|nr:flagellar hook-basal body complex protein FliE [Bryobacteraceae bacterium]
MSLSIPALSSLPLTAASSPAVSQGKPGEFQSILEGAIQGVENLRTDAARAVESFLSGETEELHTAALATQRAELALELGLQVRNKVVQAYQEIMRMPM